tara:strand:- start:81 stop:788 length:708 start_codon:yes stop_codon:yes gene_type:complete
MEPFFSVGVKENFLFDIYEQKSIKKLAKSLGPMWKYADYKSNPIETKLNKFGYRTKQDYLPDEYYLMLGCSHTFGQYLHDKDTAANMLEIQLGKPIINLGIRGGASNAMAQNLQRLMMSSYQKPKAIFAQWPEIYRYTFFAENSVKNITAGVKEPKRLLIFKYLLNMPKVFQTASNHAYEYVNSLGIPVINYSLNGCSADYFGIKEIDRIDFARDNLHAGAETNKKIASFVMEKL